MQAQLLQDARVRVAGQMRDCDALQGKIDAMNTEVAASAHKPVQRPNAKPFQFAPLLAPPS
jgi:hypothetical protein